VFICVHPWLKRLCAFYASSAVGKDSNFVPPGFRLRQGYGGQDDEQDGATGLNESSVRSFQSSVKSARMSVD